MRRTLLFTLGFVLAALFPRPSNALEKESASLTLTEKIADTRKRDGDVFLLSDHRGIAAYASDLSPVAILTATPGQFLRFDEKKNFLYFFTTTELRRVDLSTGRETTIALIPKLKHRIFGSENSGGINPVEFIRREGEVGVDFQKEIACFNIMDRDENMSNAEVNYQIHLDSGKVEFRVIWDATSEKRRENSGRLCEVTGEQREPITSPSGEWRLIRKPILPGADYIHHRLFLSQIKTKLQYAILPEGIVKARPLSKQRLEEACSVVSEDHVEWLRHHDILVIQSCWEEGFFIPSKGRAEEVSEQDNILTIADLKNHKIQRLPARAFLVLQGSEK